MVEERSKRRLAAILAADVVGYSRLMEADEAATFAALKARRKDILQPIVASHDGRIVKLMGDGVLVEFGSAVDAVDCAMRLQEAMGEPNARLPGDRQILLRIGVNLGDVMVDMRDLYGDGVNIAVRLQSMAEPGGILISGTTYDQVKTKIKVGFDDLGAQSLKNIDQPVRVYRIAALSAAIPSKATTGKSSIAVLPFTNMSTDPEQQYLSDGIAEDIITELSRFRELVVIARNSSFQYRDKSTDVRRVGRELGADYLVEGSLRKAGGRVRITAQLVEAVSGSHLWAEHYDRDLSDIFVILDEVTRVVVASLFGRLADLSVSRKPTLQWGAYDLLLRARALLGRFGLAAAETLVQQAVELDPRFAEAHAIQAKIHLARYYDDCRRETLDKALASAQVALSCDEHNGLCQSMAGMVYLFVRRFDLAARYLDRAVQLNPNHVVFLMNKAMVLARTGRSSEALEMLDTVRQRDPFLPPTYWAYRAIPLMQQRRHEDVIQSLSLIGELPTWARVYLAAAYAHLGRDEEARAEVATIKRLQPDLTIARSIEGEAWQDPADLDHVVAGLRKTGFPE